MSDKFVSIETVKGLFKPIPANMPFEIAECLLNERLNALPAVPQEMSAREFLVAYKRMCASFPETDCSKCPIYTPYKDCTDNPCDWDIDKILPAVEKWAREHPERSEE